MARAAAYELPLLVSAPSSMLDLAGILDAAVPVNRVSPQLQLRFPGSAPVKHLTSLGSSTLPFFLN